MSTAAVTVRVPAKVNLRLEVGGPQPDGYHALATVFHAVSLFDEVTAAAVGPADDPDVQVRGFECLGACDIAPMVSVDGVFVGPVDEGEVEELARQITAGEDPLPAKQLIRRPSADPHANTREWDRPGTDFAQVESEIERPAPGSDPLPTEPSSFGPPMGHADPEENA